MRIVNQSAELVAITVPRSGTIAEFIERTGRICWRSDPKGEPVEFCRRLVDRQHESVIEHASFSVRLVTSRAIADELLRHRHISATVESTRYVDLGKCAGGVDFVQPLGLDGVGLAVWQNACKLAAEAYRTLVFSGVKRQDARAVLPLCVATRLVVTANLREWRHIFALRLAPAAHPEMRALMGMVRELALTEGLGWAFEAEGAQ